VLVENLLCRNSSSTDELKITLFILIASQAIVQVITKSEEINRVILSSSVDEEFLQSKFSTSSCLH
jgi:hypothetical protein